MIPKRKIPTSLCGSHIPLMANLKLLFSFSLHKWILSPAPLPSWRLSWGLQFLRPFQTPLYLHSLCCKIHGKGASHPPHISSKEASWSPTVALAGARDQNFTCQTCTHHMSHTTPQGHSLLLCDIPGTSPQDTDACLSFPTPPV